MSAMTREQSEQISIDFSTKPNLNLVSKHPDAESFNNFHIDFIFLNIVFCLLTKCLESFLFYFLKDLNLCSKCQVTNHVGVSLHHKEIYFLL